MVADYQEWSEYDADVERTLRNLCGQLREERGDIEKLTSYINHLDRTISQLKPGSEARTHLETQRNFYFTGLLKRKVEIDELTEEMLRINADRNAA